MSGVDRDWKKKAPLRGYLILFSGVLSTVLRETCRELDAVLQYEELC